MFIIRTLLCKKKKNTRDFNGKLNELRLKENTPLYSGINRKKNKAYLLTLTQYCLCD